MPSWRQIALGPLWKIDLERPNALPLAPSALPAPDDLTIDRVLAAPDRDWLPSVNGELPFAMDPTKQRRQWLKYRFRAEWLPDNLSVYMDRAPGHRLWLNGVAFEKPETDTLWDFSNVRYATRTAAKTGWNDLIVQLLIDGHFDPDIVLPWFGAKAPPPVVLSGAFRVETDEDGRPLTLPVRDRQIIGDARALGFPYYAGTIFYEQTFDWDSSAKELWLDLGEVAHAADVFLNGAPVGSCCRPPYVYALTPCLREGPIVLRIAVMTHFGGIFPINPFFSIGAVNKPPPVGLTGPVRLMASDD